MIVADFLLDMLKKQYGENISKQIIEGFASKRKVTFRVNTLKTSVDEVEKILKREKIEYEKVKWCEEAIKMEKYIFKVYHQCYHQ